MSNPVSIQQASQVLTTQVLPLVHELLGQNRLGQQKIEPFTVVRDPWGVTVKAPFDAVDQAWAGRLAETLRSTTAFRACTVEFTAREVPHIRSIDDLTDPSTDRMVRVSDGPNASRVQLAIDEAVWRFGKSRLRLEVSLRRWKQ